MAIDPMLEAEEGVVEEAQTSYTPPPISGYRTLTQEEVDLVNRINEKLAEFALLCEEVGNIPVTEGYQRYENPVRAVAIAETQMQTAGMWLKRAVMRPRGF